LALMRRLQTVVRKTHARRRATEPGWWSAPVHEADCEARAEDTNHLKREVATWRVLPSA
jgi:hypothetical protein